MPFKQIEELALFTLMKMQNSSSNAGPAPVEDADRKRTSSVGSASIASGNSFIPVATVSSKQLSRYLTIYTVLDFHGK